MSMRCFIRIYYVAVNGNLERNDDPILRAAEVAMRFGGVSVLDSVSLSLAPGDLSGLIGPNGAGKTTLFDILAGERRPTSGQVFVRGNALERRPPHARLGQGMGRTFQIPRPFAAMSVLENVMLGCQNHAGEHLLANWFSPKRVARIESTARARAMEILEFVTLANLAHQPAGILSGGQRKLLELARVLMAQPRLILLDEPAAGVHPALLDVIIERIAALNRRGITFLIVEHNLDLIARLCRHVFVMAAGALLCEGAPREITRDPRVIEAYLGDPLT
jgi:branched-chain amino acid transport system ATP-binding protein